MAHEKPGMVRPYLSHPRCIMLMDALTHSRQGADTGPGLPGPARREEKGLAVQLVEDTLVTAYLNGDSNHNQERV